VNTKSLLAIDLGTHNTRASLFEVVAGQYRYIASGTSPTTAGAPINDVGEGVYRAVSVLQEMTGRTMIGDDARLIMSAPSGSSGYDQLVVTHSCGPELRIVIAGLMPELSLHHARQLAATLRSERVETIDICDRRRTEVQVDAIIQARPDLILLTGGTNCGANRSVLKMVEVLILVSKVLQGVKNPEIIFAGNKALSEKVKEYLGKYAHVHLAPNIGPPLERENFDQGMDIFAGVVNQIRCEQLGGFQLLEKMGSVPPIPTSHAFGTMIKFLSLVDNKDKGVLGVDLGASSLTIAAAVAGSLSLQTMPFGSGTHIQNLTKPENLAEVGRWLTLDIPLSVVRDYLWHKSLFPNTIPNSCETLALEGAAARQTLRSGMAMMSAQWPLLNRSFEPIIASGMSLTQNPNRRNNLLLLLDGLQPVGITTIILDQNGLVSSLGAAAKVNSIIPVQVLESGAFLNLGTVIAPISRARFGTKILRVHVEYEDGTLSLVDIKQGMLISIPLQPGHTARVHLEVFNGAEIDLFGKRGTMALKILGGECGIVIDGRGRPLDIPQDKNKRIDLLLKWAGFGNS
jgi:hypothetical protein